MANRWQSLNDVFSGLVRSNFGARLGPGVFTTIASTTVAGFVAISLVAWALSAVPWLALIAIFGVGLLLYYLIERTYKYAEEHPVPALLSGGEVAKLSERQMSASDRSTVSDEAPQVGAPASTIEAQLNTHV